VIRADDRIAAVLARDERLLDVLVAASPAFEKLRSSAMRKTMARLVTVEQAARIAGIDPAQLIDRLNAALHGQAPAVGAAISAPQGAASLPPVPEALRALPAGSVLRVRAIFEPAPLYAVLAKYGLGHVTERLADDDWRVWFHHDASARATGDVARAAIAADDDDDVIVLDVRGLEPPEPMVRTLEALAVMPRGKTLVQLNVRVPQYLLPKLEQRGFTYEVREQGPDLVRLFVRHR